MLGLSSQFSSLKQTPVLLGAKHDATFAQVIRRELHRYLVTRKNAYVVHTHLSRNVPENHVSVFELHAKRCIRQGFDNLTLHFDDIFLGHSYSARREPGPSEVGLLEKAFILMRHHIGLDLGHEVHSYDHNDQQ